MFEFLTQAQQYILDLADCEALELHERYIKENNYPNDRIYDNNEDFIETLGDKWAVACAVCHGEWNPYHDYAVLDGYGNPKSFERVRHYLMNDDSFCEWVEKEILKNE